MYLDWLRNYHKPMLIVRYEELVAQPKKTVERIIKFVELPLVKNYVRCMMRRKEGIYRRRKPFLPFNPFSPELTKMLKEQQLAIDNEIRRRKLVSY